MGGKDDYAGEQVAAGGSLLEHDCMIFDPKGNPVGTSFRLIKIENGMMTGFATDKDGNQFEFEKTCGHVFVPDPRLGKKKFRRKTKKAQENATNKKRRVGLSRPKASKTPKLGKSRAGAKTTKSHASARRKKKSEETPALFSDVEDDDSDTNPIPVEEPKSAITTIPVEEPKSATTPAEEPKSAITTTPVEEPKSATTPVEEPKSAITTTPVEEPKSATTPVEEPKSAIATTEEPKSVIATTEETKSDGEDGKPTLPSGFESFAAMAVARKKVWRNSSEVLDLMTEYLPDVPRASWTMKRLLRAIVKKHQVKHRVHDNTAALGRAIDFWEVEMDDDTARKVLRWSNTLDLARLLQLMFGDETSRANYLASRQLATRSRLDSTTRTSLKSEYWLALAKRFNDQDLVVAIDVGRPLVNLFLQSHMRTSFRGSWSADKLRQTFRRSRADYEGSQVYARFQASGQNDGENFYPDFCTNNPGFVMMHYMLMGMPQGSVLGDMPAETIVDTGGSANQPIEVSDDDETPDTETPVIRRRRNKKPPVSTSVTRSVSSQSSSVPSRVSRDMYSMMGSLHNLLEKMNQPTLTSVYDRSSEALKLIEMKKSLRQKLRELSDDSDADEDDKVLVSKNLDTIIQRIKDVIHS